MPELPEVEYAARLARAACAGKELALVRALHPSQRRALPDSIARALTGDVVLAVERRGKHQLFHLASRRIIHVHFRMTGDWRITSADEPPHRSTRVAFTFTDGTQLALDDARALSVVALCEAGVDPCPGLGPEATSASFNATWLAEQLTGRRSPIKPVLLDQGLVAGIGNIYASEALWYAKVDPRRAAHRLSQLQISAIVSGVKRALRKALEHPERYYGANGVSDAVRFNVYDRAGKGCRRCSTPIRRLVQAARGTYYCPTCQKS